MLKASAFPERYTRASLKKPPFVSLVKGVTFVLVQLPTENVLAAVPPNLGLLKSHNGLDKDWAADGSSVGFFFFVKDGHIADGSTKLRTRMLVGSLEDPATGSASSALAAYLALHEPDTGTKFHMVQGFETERRSEIGVEVILEEDRINKITLRGSAVSVMEGSLVV
jgi:PhzF family phenazine biosynthesis protein